MGGGSVAPPQWDRVLASTENNTVPFEQYLGGIDGARNSGNRNVGVFGVPYARQSQLGGIVEQQTNGPNAGLRSINEDIENASLVNFITAICITRLHDPQFQTISTGLLVLSDQADVSRSVAGVHL